MTPLIFWYHPDQEHDHVAATPDEIDAALAEVTRQDVDTDGLYVGIKGPVGTLHYVGHGTGIYSQNRDAAGKGSNSGTPLRYDYQWNLMEFSADSEIPVAKVRTAVHEYFYTGTRPSSVQWQHWSPPHNPDSIPMLAHDDPAWNSPSQQ